MRKAIIVISMLSIAIFLSILLFDLSTKALEQRVQGINYKNRTFTIDCPVIKFSPNGRDDIGYLCEVKTDEDTTIRNSEGELVSFQHIVDNDYVSITLSKRRFITANSRTLVAEEIIILSE